MADLILTPEEKKAALWADLDDASLGRFLKKVMADLDTMSPAVEDKAIRNTAAGQLLVLEIFKSGFDQNTIKIGGVTQHGHEIGD